ncbi:MAG: TonB-dependent receptor [Myxococcota bacterium]
MIIALSTILGAAYAADDEEDDATPEIVVTAYRISDAPEDAPVSTSVLEEDDIALGRPTLEMGEALAQVPGVFVANRSNFAQDTRLSIRGFGSRAAFGIRGLRVFLDGIPLTLPDGQSQVDSLDFANIGRIEVLRGPAGSLYGNAAGGVLTLQTRRPTDSPEAEAITTVGAFGLLKTAVGGRVRAGDTDVSLFAARTAMAGWRDQSSVEHVTVQSHVATPLGPRARWSANVHYVRAPVADDPGGLNPEDFEANPQSAAQTNLDFGTGEDLTQLQVGTRLTADPSAAHRVEVTGHAGTRSFVGSIPFAVTSFDRDFFGGMAVYRWRADTGAVQSQLAAGLEVQGQQDFRRREGNDAGRPNGVATNVQDERVTGLGVFVQERLDLAERLHLLGSARYDRVDFRLIDLLLDKKGGSDLSGTRSFDQVTGQGGLLVDISNPVSVYANVAQSFETPTLSELVNSSGDGGLDPDLAAQRALSVEGGINVRTDNVAVQAAIFGMNLDNELLRQENDEGQAFFTNAGQSRRFGAELYTRAKPLEILELLGSYTWLRAEFREEARRGQRLPGLPEHRGFVRARVVERGVHVAAEAEIVSTLFADDANLITAPAYGLVGLRAGYTLTQLDPVEIDLTLGVRNLLDSNYADNTRSNAFGDRFFEAGLPRHFYGQLTVAYR